MTPARIVTAVLLGLVSAAVSWVGLDLLTRSGADSPPLSWAAVAGTALILLLVIGAGLPVRRWVRGRRERMLDPIVAARTAVLAKTAAYGGAVIAGWYVAQAVLLLPDLVGDRRHRFVIGLVAGALAVGVSVAGFVVQRWCRIPPGDDELEGPKDPEHDSAQ